MTKTALRHAYESRLVEPESKLVFHSDQGSNYTAVAFVKYVASLGIKQSFSGKAMPFDNAVCESFFNTMKREEVYRTKYTFENHFRKSIEEFIEYYNENRPHSKLKYKTPNKTEQDYYQRKTKVSV